MRAIEILAFIPQEAILPMVVLGGIAMALQLRGIASALFTMAALIIFLPMLLEPVLDMLPEWTFPFLEIFLCISIAGTVITLLIGKNAKDHMVGILAADFIKWLLFTPFTMAARIIRWLIP